MTAYVLVVAGLGSLVLGAEWLVRGASDLAARMGMSPLLVGLTVVSVATSLPEMAVSVDATLNGAGPLAVGNIAGTNIVNIALILGMSAAITPLALRRQTLRLDLPVMVISGLLLLALSIGGSLGRVDGAILLSVAVLYTLAAVRGERRERDQAAAGLIPTPDIGDAGEFSGRPALRIVQFVTGVAIVVIGAEWLVDGAVEVAADLGVSEALIGLTVVAIGTSAPELTTAVVATLRGNRELAIGNLIGSGVYNITLILGTAALVRPLAVTDELIRIDIPIMAAVALLCIPVFLSGRRISRAEGIGMVTFYLVYLVYLIVVRA